MPTPSWTGSCTTRSGSTWARPTCGSAADRPVAIKKHRGQCRPRCPSAISAVLFRDIQQCSSEQILTALSQNPYYGIPDSRKGAVFPFSTAGRRRIYINISCAIEIISHIKAVINTYFFNAQDHCIRPALINAK